MNASSCQIDGRPVFLFFTRRIAEFVYRFSTNFQLMTSTLISSNFYKNTFENSECLKIIEKLRLSTFSFWRESTINASASIRLIEKLVLYCVLYTFSFWRYLISMQAPVIIANQVDYWKRKPLLNTIESHVFSTTPSSEQQERTLFLGRLYTVSV